MGGFGQNELGVCGNTPRYGRLEQKVKHHDYDERNSHQPQKNASHSDLSLSNAFSRERSEQQFVPGYRNFIS
jgi:hypothetical protein